MGRRRVALASVRGRSRAAALCALSLASLAACGAPAPTAEAPASESATPVVGSASPAVSAKPASEADATEVAELTALTGGGFGRRTDKWDTLSIRFADWPNWKRVRIFGQPTRATFKYGEDGAGLLVVFYTPSEGPDDPRSCLDRFLKFADETASTYDIDYKKSPVYEREQSLPDRSKRPMLVVLAEGKVNAAFANDDYVGAVAVYQSFPGTCLVQAFATKATRHPDLARKARDHWVTEAAPYLTWGAKVTEAPSLDAR
jgi:hypothetical protein